MDTSDVLSALAIRSSELERWEHIDSRWLHIWTGMVVVGVALELAVIFFEFREDLHAFRLAIIRSPERPSVKKVIFEVFACALVVVGVAGEFFIARSTEDIGTELRIISNEQVGIAEREAGIANKEAGDARRKASENEKETALLSKENLLLRSAVDKVEKHAAQRIIREPQKLVDKLKPLGTQFADMYVYGGEDDTLALAATLESILTNGDRWFIRKFIVPSQFQRGVMIDNFSSKTPDTDAVVTALVEGLNTGKVLANRLEDPQAVPPPRIVVPEFTPIGWTLQRAPIRIMIGAKMGYETPDGRRF
jgi:hypothetical protein